MLTHIKDFIRLKKEEYRTRHINNTINHSSHQQRLMESRTVPKQQALNDIFDLQRKQNNNTGYATVPRSVSVKEIKRAPNAAEELATMVMEQNNKKRNQLPHNEFDRFKLLKKIGE